VTALTPEVSPGGPGGGGRSRGRLGLLVAAGVVVLALLGLLLVTQLGGDDSKDDPGGTVDPTGEEGTTGGEQKPGEDDEKEGDAEGADEGATGGQDPDQDPDPGDIEPDEGDTEGDTGGQDPDPSGPPVTSPDRDPDASIPPGSGSPSGYSRQINLAYRFSMSFPDGWQQTGTAGQNSGAIYSDPDGGPPKLQVDFNGTPGSDARQAWLDLEDAVRQNSTDYERISITAIEWRDYPTVADWEFERTEDGVRVHILNRGFRVDEDRGYAVMVTCVASEWDGNDCRTLRETAFKTFLPLE
jgi:hypothetical protein